MSSTAQSYPALAYGPLRLPMAAFEVLGYLSVIAVATLCFLAGWLPVNGAVVLTVILLTTLIVLSWIHLGQGRHPRLLFLCSLALFQGGRLIGYCLGGEPHPMRVVAMTSPFDISREDAGLTLLALSLSAICIYAPCRWMYRSIAPPKRRQSAQVPAVLVHSVCRCFAGPTLQELPLLRIRTAAWWLPFYLCESFCISVQRAFFGAGDSGNRASGFRGDICF